ncbi:AVAST type 1 anti-phage system MBL fold metallo-hydrolase Avs1a [Halobacillus rhizosphaerae]|uniref:AVAST type 1 anti-phage system MBL fold metallo-hydrolase Avs1a n=1 Tax=Halobacillus rhizosphaerae TaxID=3064889 RepID=UPI00398BA619
MSDISIEIFPALEGDCFLVSMGSEHKVNILIDGGYKETYYNHLKPRLKQMNQNGERIDLVIVTHIDADHIEGIIELLKENGSSEEANVIQIYEIWHNSYKHLQFFKDSKEELDYREKTILTSKIAQGYIGNKNTDEDHNQNEDISAKDGSTLAALIYEGKYNWNTSFNENSISIENKKKINLNENVVIRLLGPNNNSLKKLNKYWLKELRKEKYDFKLTEDELFDDAFEFYMLNQKNIECLNENEEISSRSSIDEIDCLLKQKNVLDRSPVNGSSITTVIEYKGKKLLFLADSHPQLVDEQIQQLVDQIGYIPFFELIKVSHHGSRKNTSIELLDLIDSPNYVFSTNGKKHNHPNEETIARIISREIPSNLEKRELIFNYFFKNELFCKEEIQQRYNYSISLPNGELTKVLKI